MKYLIVAIIAAVIISLLVLTFALCKVSSRCSREEEKMEYQAMTKETVCREPTNLFVGAVREMSATAKESN